MASIPVIGNKFLAKVKLQVYLDENCTKQILPVPPGPNGLKSTWQYPGSKETGTEVGVYTGKESKEGYEIDYILNYRIAKQKALGFDYSDVVKAIKAWVKKNEVTGYWDTGIDAPINTPGIKSEPDNTNLYLSLGLGAALVYKFVLPKTKK